MKKKKFLAAAVAVALAGGMVFSFAGCDLLVKKPDNNYPYDGAVADGFTGTEAEWLASQYDAGTREYRLYEEAKQEGYTGSYLEFLKELGTGVTDDSAGINRALTSVVAIENVYRQETAYGSGVIISLDKTSGDAFIVTNYHVVYCVSSRYGTLGIGKDLRVGLYGGTGRTLSASFYGGAMEYDIAVLKVTGSEYLRETAEEPVYATAAQIADSDSLTVGQRVYALGNPDGEGFSATGGIVSVEAEQIEITRADNNGKINLLEIRTDAAVNHGNSGGGLFDASGRLVGIVNARSESTGVVAFGYAIPANLAIPLARNIIDNYSSAGGNALVARLGVTMKVQEGKGVYDESSGKYFIEEKVVIDTVEMRSAANAAGLKRGDTLISATLNRAGNSQTVQLTRLHKLSNLLMQARFGDTLTLKVSREGKLAETTVNFNDASYFATIR